jgi:hypothetical protein
VIHIATGIRELLAGVVRMLHGWRGFLLPTLSTSPHQWASSWKTPKHPSHAKDQAPVRSRLTKPLHLKPGLSRGSLWALQNTWCLGLGLCTLHPRMWANVVELKCLSTASRGAGPKEHRGVTAKDNRGGNLPESCETSPERPTWLLSLWARLKSEEPSRARSQN